MEFRRLTQADDPDWAALLAAAFDRSTDNMLALLRWQRAGFPVEAWGAWDGARLVAQYSSLITHLHVPSEEQPIPTGFCVNMATHPDYRGKGLIKHVARPVYETLAGQGVMLGIGFSNAAGVQVDRHSEHYQYQVVGRMLPVMAVVPFFPRRSTELTFTDTLHDVPVPSPNGLIQFVATPSDVVHRFAEHPFRRYAYGIWREGDNVVGVVVFRRMKLAGIPGVGLLAAYADHHDRISDLLRHWIRALPAARFVYALVSPRSTLRTTLEKTVGCLTLPVTRSPYYLTVKPLQDNVPKTLLDFAQWDCAGGDVL